jgi:hypothetical protein
MTFTQRLKEHVEEHQTGMVFDLLFALAWVGLVSAFFSVVEGPQWAFYLFMLAGIPAYFGFTYSWSLAKETQS